MSKRTAGAAFAVIVASGALAPRAARAWDDFGHMEVAAVAYKALTPKTKARVAKLLTLNPAYASWIAGAGPAEQERAAFLRAATWADAIKADPRYTTDAQSAPTAARTIGYADLLRHPYWHYVNLPLSADGTPTRPPEAPNLATQLPRLRAALAAETTPDDVKSYDLVWILHLVGDAHQPLHCVARFDAADPSGDRGGNNVKIAGNVQPPICDDPRYCPFGPPRNLHLFVDDIVGASYATAPAVSAAAKLPRPPAAAAAVRDEGAWIAEGVELARTTLYVSPIGAGAGPFEITPAYQQAAYALGQRRIALAGARLANLLNDALGK